LFSGKISLFKKPSIYQAFYKDFTFLQTNVPLSPAIAKDLLPLSVEPLRFIWENNFSADRTACINIPLLIFRSLFLFVFSLFLFSTFSE